MRNTTKSGRKAKIDKAVLHRMLAQGVPRIQIARHFQVHPSAITQAAKNLTVNISRNVQMAADIVDENIDILRHLNKKIKIENDMIDLIQRWIDGDPTAEKKFHRHHKLGNVFSKKGGNSLSFKDPKELLVIYLREQRADMQLALNIYESLYNFKAVKEFQESVLTIIASENKETRDRIVAALKENQAIRSVVKIQA